jgi:hypothetical protein
MSQEGIDDRTLPCLNVTIDLSKVSGGLSGRRVRAEREIFPDQSYGPFHSLLGAPPRYTFAPAQCVWSSWKADIRLPSSLPMAMT